MIQGRIRAVRFEQALVRALLDDFAMVDDQNHVGLTDRRKPVRDDERGRALHQRVRRLLNQHFGFRVHGAGRLVEHENLRPGDHRAGEGNELLFAGGELVAAFADVRIVALFELRRDSIRADRSGRRVNLFVRRLRPAVAGSLPERRFSSTDPENRCGVCRT